MQASEEIKNKLDIVDLIKEYIQLTPAGMNFRARCPFHNEKTPSFMVSPDKQIWHCFGCGKGGDVFTFVMEMEGIDFVEALRTLAKKTGIVLRRQDPKMISERNRFLDIVEISRRYFHQVLTKTDAAKRAREYLANRELNQETIEEWQIGYSLDSWDSLLNFLKKQGFREPEIQKAGLITSKPGKRSYYDRFRARIMFPINDINGNTVAFSARVSPEKEKKELMGKYINSPQTSIYNKSKIIFGLDRARQEIRSGDLSIVVEGQMDVISAHQHGFKNVVASSGTALTADQIGMLKRYSLNMLLAFDMDEAGQMAADRGIKEALKQEMNVSVVDLPEGMDPDDCIRKDPELWKKAIKNAKPIMDFYFERTFRGLDLNKVADKRVAAAKILPLIAGMANGIERGHWLKSLSGAIDVDEHILSETLKQARTPKKIPGQTANQPTQPARPKKANRTERLSELFLSFLFKFFTLFEYAMQNMPPEQLDGEDNRDIYKKLVFYYNIISQDSQKAEATKSIDPNDFINELVKTEKENDDADKGGQAIKSQLNKINKLVLLVDKSYGEIDINQAREELIKIIVSLRKNTISKRKKELERKISLAERQKDEAASRELLEELNILSEELKELE